MKNGVHVHVRKMKAHYVGYCTVVEADRCYHVFTPFGVMEPIKRLTHDDALADACLIKAELTAPIGGWAKARG